MKVIINLLAFFFIFLSIKYIELKDTNNFEKEHNEAIESFEACIRLRRKSNFNLKCEDLLDKNEKMENIEKISKTKIKTLSFDESETRRVNKKVEGKLRNLMSKISNENRDKF